jgi:hypothetical protein
LHAEEYGNGDYIPTVDVFLDEGQKVYTGNPERAAVKFAEEYQARQAWYPREMTVLVMDNDCRRIHKYVVNQEAVPSYWVDALYEPVVLEAIEADKEV